MTPDPRERTCPLGPVGGYLAEGQPVGGLWATDAIPVPLRWPSAWPHLWHAARDRAVFVAAVVVLTTVGIITAGDLVAQWWVPLVPLLLLCGPITRPGRVRRALQRGVARGRLRATAGRIHPGRMTSRGRTARLVTSSNHAVPLPACRAVAAALAEHHVGERALLVWTPWWSGARAAAVVLGTCRVAYLCARPSGARRTTTRLRVTAQVFARVWR